MVRFRFRFRFRFPRLHFPVLGTITIHPLPWHGLAAPWKRWHCPEMFLFETQDPYSAPPLSHQMVSRPFLPCVPAYPVPRKQANVRCLGSALISPHTPITSSKHEQKGRPSLIKAQAHVPRNPSVQCGSSSADAAGADEHLHINRNLLSGSQCHPGPQQQSSIDSAASRRSANQSLP